MRKRIMSEDRITTGSSNGLSEIERTETEVVTRASRRSFSVNYKKRICDRADACTRSGDLGALLRREGLHSSTLRRWRLQRDEGILGGLSRRGPKRVEETEHKRELAQKQKRIDQLEKQLERAEMIIDVQKKVSVLLGVSLSESEDLI